MHHSLGSCIQPGRRSGILQRQQRGKSLASPNHRCPFFLQWRRFLSFALLQSKSKMPHHGPYRESLRSFLLGPLLRLSVQRSAEHHVPRSFFLPGRGKNSTGMGKRALIFCQRHKALSTVPGPAPPGTGKGERPLSRRGRSPFGSHRGQRRSAADGRHAFQSGNSGGNKRKREWIGKEGFSPFCSRPDGNGLPTPAYRLSIPGPRPRERKRRGTFPFPGRFWNGRRRQCRPPRRERRRLTPLIHWIGTKNASRQGRTVYWLTNSVADRLRPRQSTRPGQRPSRQSRAIHRLASFTAHRRKSGLLLCLCCGPMDQRRM